MILCTHCPGIGYEQTECRHCEGTGEDVDVIPLGEHPADDAATAEAFKLACALRDFPVARSLGADIILARARWERDHPDESGTPPASTRTGG